MIILFNELYEKLEDRQLNMRQWWKYPLMDLVIMFIPVIFANHGILILIVYIWKPNLSVFVYSALGEGQKGVFAQVLLAFLEILFVINLASTGTPLLLIYLSTLKILTSKTGSSIISVRNIQTREKTLAFVRIYHEFTVLLKLFNTAFVNVNYALKLVYMYNLIVILVAAVKFSRTSLGFTLILLSLFAQHFLGFSALFGYAYNATARVRVLKAEIVIACMMEHGRDDRYMKKFVESLTVEGIRVGAFHTVERESIPNFVDFLIKNVASVLLLFG
ncbi:unnamed protein product [Allacma fusca]|uniref:Uncharacterized protein n=1 Tax=Allacma fusca TaxID=39272 RepID=A0A8J2KT19_9HEXA|nr:unnamed protein product [Allacma fusca]